uniref:Uncharacterized protein n=1 Tax=Lygus hesperus TaxID=30085 RepID=A0A146LJF6_LYGHE
MQCQEWGSGKDKEVSAYVKRDMDMYTEATDMNNLRALLAHIRLHDDNDSTTCAVLVNNFKRTTHQPPGHRQHAISPHDKRSYFSFTDTSIYRLNAHSVTHVDATVQKATPAAAKTMSKCGERINAVMVKDHLMNAHDAEDMHAL